MGEKKGEAGGRPDSEEMAVSSREEHVPDYLSRRKDIILFAPIVPHFAETLKLLVQRMLLQGTYTSNGNRSSRFLHVRKSEPYFLSSTRAFPCSMNDGGESDCQL